MHNPFDHLRENLLDSPAGGLIVTREGPMLEFGDTIEEVRERLVEVMMLEGIATPSTVLLWTSNRLGDLKNTLEKRMLEPEYDGQEAHLALLLRSL